MNRKDDKQIVEELITTVESAQGGNVEAFSALVVNFQDMAVGYAYSYLKDFHRSEDVAQEAFCEAYHKLPQIQKPGSFACWFRKIVFKHCDRITRKNEVEVIPIDALGDMLPSKEMLHDSEFHEALNALSDKEREVINLTYIAKYSRKEVAEFLCTSTRSVDRLLQSSKQQLKGFLDMTKKELHENRPSKDKTFADGVEANITADIPVEPILKHIKYGDLENTLKLLKDHPEILSEDFGDYKILHYAAQCGQCEIIEALVEMGCDINEPHTNHEIIPLHYACSMDQLDAVKLLTERGSDLNYENSDGMKAIDYYAYADAPKVGLDYLISKGSPQTMFSAIAYNDPVLVRALSTEDERTLQVKYKIGHTSFTPLHFASFKDLPDMVEVLIELGADVHAMDEQNRTPVDIALNCGSQKAYGIFFKRDIKANPELLKLVSSPEESQCMARLHKSITTGKVKEVEEQLHENVHLLNKKFPDIWGTGGTYGATPLHWAAMFGHINVAKYLMDLGADIHIKDETYSGTPLGWAKEMNQQAMFEFLKPFYSKSE